MRIASRTWSSSLLRRCSSGYFLEVGNRGVRLYTEGVGEFVSQGMQSLRRLTAASWSVKSMPTALRTGPYRFYFYSYDCGEPRHMHADREHMSAKFWLDPDVSLAENYGFNRKELRDIERSMRENLETLRNEWDKFCGTNAYSG